MVRPSSTARSMDWKLSSASTISAASLVASVPLMPMATPTSARFKAGASLTPSPVMATTSPLACRAVTRRSLCSGLVRANTTVSRTSSCSCPSVAASSSLPVTARPSLLMPISRAMALAVPAWSPVIITTRMPACRQLRIASIASGRGGSMMPTRPRKTMSACTSSMARVSVPSSASRRAAASTRSPSAPRLSIRSSQKSRSSGTTEPSASSWCVLQSSSRSGAPLSRMRTPPAGSRLRVAMNLLSDSKGTTASRS